MEKKYRFASLQFVKIVFLTGCLAIVFSSFCLGINPTTFQMRRDSLVRVLNTSSDDTIVVTALDELFLISRQNGELDMANYYCRQGITRSIKTGNADKLLTFYNNLSMLYAMTGRLDTAQKILTHALAICDSLDQSKSEAVLKSSKKGRVAAYGNLGLIYESSADYPQALNFVRMCLKSAEELGLDLQVARALASIGLIYKSLSDYPNALDFMLKSLKMQEKINDKYTYAAVLGNIGILYGYLKEYPTAIDYSFKSLELMEELGDKLAVATIFVNIGSFYERMNQFDSALYYNGKGLRICEVIGNPEAEANTLGSIGLIYEKLMDYQKALDVQFKSLRIRENIGDKQGIVNSLGNIGSIYHNMNEYSLSVNYSGKAVQIAQEIGDIDAENEFQLILSNSYKAMGNYTQALVHYEKHILLRDSVFKIDNQKEILRKQMKFDYEKKAAADSVKNAEEQKVKEAQIQAQQAQIKQEQTQRYALYGGLALVVLFAGFIYNRFRVTQKQKAIIEEQKKLVETKNEEILDSIHYAKRIQQALLPTDYVLKKHLSEHFILYKPKDIVSGDFYYLATCPPHLGEGSRVLLALADCTGHGVPGAFMSLLNISFLNECINEKKITRPDEILIHVREEVIKALNPEGGSEKGMDGMDCSLISFGFQVPGFKLDEPPGFGMNPKPETSNLKLNLACANNPVYIVRKGALTVIKPDRQAVGFSYNPKPFTLQEVELQEGDTIYMITDGFGDQFGGPKGKRFKKDKLKELLLTISNQSMEGQKRNLEKTFEEWKGNLEQTDDVTIIGIRI